MGIPIDADPNARTVCPHGCLVLVKDWRMHDDWHRALEERLQGIEDALGEPAPEAEPVPWPAAPEPDTDTATMPAGPYAPEPGPQL